VTGISESVHLLYPDIAFRNFIGYKGNPNFCILVLVIVTLMIDTVTAYILLKSEFQYNQSKSKK
jgi:hypothetical protein